MSDLRERLEALPEPELDAVDRLWVRFQTTQALEPRRRRRRWLVASSLAVAAAAALVGWAIAPETPRHADLSARVTPETLAWSPQIQLEALGTGEIAGTSRDATIRWDSGTVRVRVEPHSGTRLAVQTPEARVEVVGTKFDVTRDPLGSTVTVDRGRVRVTCGDGWAGDLGAGQRHTCLPLTADELLGRVTALEEAGRTEPIDETLERGLALAQGPVRGELLARRMRRRAVQGDIDGALADARAYLASPSGRDDEIRRFAGWLALEHRGCAVARPWLAELHARGSAQESVLLAECLASTDPERARNMLTQALPALDPAWRARALEGLRKVSP